LQQAHTLSFFKIGDTAAEGGFGDTQNTGCLAETAMLNDLGKQSKVGDIFHDYPIYGTVNFILTH
jgi:hypothetical protein